MLSMLPMLRVPEKKTTSVDLRRPLRSDIASKYSERQALDLEDDIYTLNDRRSQLENLAKERSFTVRLGVLSSYFRAVSLIINTFSSAKDEINRIIFTWYDAFKQKKPFQQNIHLEKAAVLFNLGALYSQIGQSKGRSTEEGRREAAEAFRRAAGAFAYLKGNAAAEAAIGKSTTVDVSVECAAMLEKLMLAQAEECYIEIFIAKGTEPEDWARISRQVALDYEEALAALNVAPLKGHVDQDWKSYLQLKAALFNAEACYGHSLKLHKEGNVGEEIARLKSGISTLSEAKKSTKGGLLQLLRVSTELKKLWDAIEKLDTNLNWSLKNAEKDKPYYIEVPSSDSLLSLPSQPMVERPIKKDEFLGDQKEKMFATLEVDEKIRIHDEKLQQCSELSHLTLKKMDLPDSVLVLGGHLTLPPDLKEDVEAVQISGGPAGLASELQLLRRVNEEAVLQTEERLQTAEIYAHIEHVVDYYSPLMSVLNCRPIKSALPIISLDASEDAIVGGLKKSLGELKILGAQGERLQQDLKHMNRKLLASTGSQEDLFKKEILKYERTCKEIDQNIEAREQLLLHIQDQNDQLSSFFNLEEYKASLQKTYGEIRAAIAEYRKIKEKINEAKKFYIALQKTVKNVKPQFGEYVMTRNIQCPEMIGLESDVCGQDDNHQTRID